MIKAIQTVYNGYRFRSRLEARWAVFFDALGIKYEYEKEGYDLGEAGYYLPDFWFPASSQFIEIKGEGASKEDMRKVKALAGDRVNTVFVFTGSPGPFSVSMNSGDPVFGGTNILGKDEYGWDSDWRWAECEHCGAFGLTQFWRHQWMYCQCLGRQPSDNTYLNYLKHGCNVESPRIIAAFNAARQAQFEHGKHGN